MKGRLTFEKDEVLGLLKKFVPFGEVNVVDAIIDTYSVASFLVIEFEVPSPQPEQLDQYTVLAEKPTESVYESVEDSDIPF